MPALLLPLLLAATSPAQQRTSVDVAKGRPVVIHVVVALADNAHQGIAPVPARLGDGDDEEHNLYWGARYGTRTHLLRHGWRRARDTLDEAPPADVLERVVLTTEVTRRGRAVPVVLVAEAWRGRAIRAATARFLALAHGRSPIGLGAGSEGGRRRAPHPVRRPQRLDGVQHPPLSAAGDIDHLQIGLELGLALGKRTSKSAGSMPRARRESR